MVHYGLDEFEVKRILKQCLNKEPDLKYYINNDYIEKLVNVLIDGIAKVIEENNNKVEQDVKRELRGF